MRKVIIATLLWLTVIPIFADLSPSSQKMLSDCLPQGLLEDLKTFNNSQKVNISSHPQTRFETRIPFDVIDSHTHYKIIGTIHKPINKHTTQFPAVIFCHGFMGHKFGNKSHYIRLAEMMVEKGVVVVRFDFQGCGDSEGDRKYFSVSDLESNGRSVMEFIKQIPFIDPNNIGIYGASLGGHVAIHLAQKYPQSVKSLALFAPIGNGYLWFLELKKAMAENSCPLGSSFLLPGESFIISDKFICEFTKIKDSILTATLPAHISVLHIQGLDDTIVSTNHRALFMGEAAKRNRWVKFITFADTGHEFTDSKHYQEIQTTISDHILESLLGFKTKN